MTSAKPDVDVEQQAGRSFRARRRTPLLPGFLACRACNRVLADLIALSSIQQSHDCCATGRRPAGRGVGHDLRGHCRLDRSFRRRHRGDRRAGRRENLGEHRRSRDPSRLRDWRRVRPGQWIDRCEGQGPVLHCHAGRDGRLSRNRPLFHPRRPVSIGNESFLDAYSGRTAGIPNSVLIALVLIGIAAFMLNLTVFGREVRAIGGGERIAHLSGIRVDRGRS